MVKQTGNELEISFETVLSGVYKVAFACLLHFLASRKFSVCFSKTVHKTRKTKIFGNSVKFVNLRFPMFNAFLAHLSRRLTGELIGYPWIGRPSVRRPYSTFSNIFSSETAWPIKAKFYVEPPWEGGTKVYINGPGHMTKMAAMPIYGKNPSKIFFSRTGGPIFTKLGM